MLTIFTFAEFTQRDRLITLIREYDPNLLEACRVATPFPNEQIPTVDAIIRNNVKIFFTSESREYAYQLSDYLQSKGFAKFVTDILVNKIRHGDQTVKIETNDRIILETL